MTTLASLTELQAFMPTVEIDPVQAQLLLEIATVNVRLETGQTISLVVDDAIEMRGTFGRSLWLPERPVLGVSSIAVDGHELAPASYRVSSNGRVTFDRDLWPLAVNRTGAAGYWGGDEVILSVVYTHGFDPVPAGPKGIVLDLVRQAIVSPDAGAITQESLGSYSVSYASVSPLTLTDAQRRSLRRYRWGQATVRTAT